MATVDFEELKTALSDEDPCGPDLDMDFDDDYMNFVANLEGLLPTTFFEDGQPFAFDPALIDVEQQRVKCLELLQRTRDLRLLVLLARTYILSRDLTNFAQTVDVITSLLDRFWDPVHPQAEAGRFDLRSAILGVLDEPTIVFSVQYCRLCETRRQGPVTFRSYLYAIREAEPRMGEEAPPESTLLQAMRDSEEQITATRSTLESLRDNFQRIGTIWAERSDLLTSPKLSNISGLVARVLAFLDLAFPQTSSQALTAVEAGEDGPTLQTPAKVATAADAVTALREATAYFLRQEPSSPVLPLVVQAQQLLGRSFPEILQALLPDQVGSAAYQIGGRQYFSLPLERLPPFETSGSTYDASSEEAEPAADDWSNMDATADAGSESEDASAEPLPVREQIAPKQPFIAKTRGQALGLLDDVAAYLRTSEPGSPVPWLIERARALAERDFLSILRAVLPESALKDLDQN
jgi:type VI secretion system protein ImpA